MCRYAHSSIPLAHLPIALARRWSAAPTSAAGFRRRQGQGKGLGSWNKSGPASWARFYAAKAPELRRSRRPLTLTTSQKLPASPGDVERSDKHPPAMPCGELSCCCQARLRAIYSRRRRPGGWFDRDSLRWRCCWRWPLAACASDKRPAPERAKTKRFSADGLGQRPPERSPACRGWPRESLGIKISTGSACKSNAELTLF